MIVRFRGAISCMKMNLIQPDLLSKSAALLKKSVWLNKTKHENDIQKDDK